MKSPLSSLVDACFMRKQYFSFLKISSHRFQGTAVEMQATQIVENSPDLQLRKLLYCLKAL